jgi:hypothetical protein
LKPTVGRIVHYTNLGDKDGKYPPQIIAAIITKVDARHDAVSDEEDGHVVSLKCLYPTGVFDVPNIEFTHADAGSEGARGRWTWPAKA